MFEFFKKNTAPLTVTAPIGGILVKLSDISNTKKLDGFAIVPDEGRKIIRCPMKGKASRLPNSSQAILVSNSEEIELIIHIGIDTRNMYGDGFNAYTSQFKEVTQGQKLSQLSSDMIKRAGLDAAIMVIFVHGYERFVPMHEQYGSDVASGDILMVEKS